MLTALNCRSKNVRVLPVVIAELELGNMGMANGNDEITLCQQTREAWMKLTARSTAASLAIIVDALHGCVDIDHAAHMLQIKPGTLTRILREIEGFRTLRSRRQGAESG